MAFQGAANPGMGSSGHRQVQGQGAELLLVVTRGFL